MTHLNEAVVLITGAGGGFGQELTRQLLQAGSRLILTDIDENFLREKVKTISLETTSGEIIAYLGANLDTRQGCETLHHQVKALGMPIDILINNAGIGLYGRMDEVPPQEWEQLMQVNLLTPMRLSSLFAAEMIPRGKGHIVNISSLAGWFGQAGMAHYAASKFGLRGFSEGLHNELKPYNIKVTAVYPFFSRTPILQSKRYGSLAEGSQEFPEDKATDPAKVMAATIEGIIHNRLHVFPDRIAKIVYILKRYSPELLALISDRFAKKIKYGESN